MLNHLQGEVWKRVWIFWGQVWKRVWKMAFFGLKLGLDLEIRAVHPHQKFQRVPHPPTPGVSDGHQTFYVEIQKKWLSFSLSYFSSKCLLAFQFCWFEAISTSYRLVGFPAKRKTLTDGYRSLLAISTGFVLSHNWTTSLDSAGLSDE